MEQTPTLLAVDAGQSGIRARVLRAAEVLDEFELPGVRTDLAVLPQMAAVAEVAATRGTPAQVMALGVSGLLEQDRAEQLAALAAPHGIREVYLAHDSISSYLGALGAEPGCICATGTGTVTLAVGAQQVARVDGWGWLMGDAGAGFWIGRRGLEAGMRAHDGRGAPTGMLAAISRDFSSVEGAYIELQADPLRVSRVASYARTVLDLAADGDQPCHAIAVQAGAELATSVAAGLRLVDNLEDPAVCGMGGIFRSVVIQAAFLEHLRAVVPSARVVEPLADSLSGASLLPGLPADHPLLRNVDHHGADQHLAGHQKGALG